MGMDAMRSQATGPTAIVEEGPPMKPCLICGAQEGQTLFIGTEERFGLGGAFPVVTCPDCGFTWTDLADDFNVDQWYEQGYWERFRSRRAGKADALHAIYRRLRYLWRALNGSPRPSRWIRGDRVLDVGCGPGYDTSELQQRGIEAIGLDISSDALRMAARQSLTVVRGEPTAYPFGDSTFDSVVLSQVLEHLPDPCGALREVYRILRPNGRLLILLPNSKSLQRYAFGSHWVNWHLPYHLWHFDAQSVTTVAERSGLRIRWVRTCSPGEWFVLSIGLRWPRLRGIGSSLTVSRIVRTLVAPVLRIVDVMGRGDCLVIEAYRPS